MAFVAAECLCATSRVDWLSRCRTLTGKRLADVSGKTRKCVQLLLKRVISSAEYGRSWHSWLPLNGPQILRMHQHDLKSYSKLRSIWSQSTSSDSPISFIFDVKLWLQIQILGGRNISVCIATCYWLDTPGFEPRWRRDISEPPRRSWGPPSLLCNGYRVSSPETKRSERGAKYRLPPSAEIECLLGM